MYVEVWKEEGTNGPGNSWRDTIYVYEGKTAGRYSVGVKRRSYPDRGPSFWVYRSRPLKSPARFLDTLEKGLQEAGTQLTSTDFLRVFARIAAEDGPFASELLREYSHRLEGAAMSRDLLWW